MKDNGFKLAKESSRRYNTQTITDMDYTDDIAPKPYNMVWNEQLLA